VKISDERSNPSYDVAEGDSSSVFPGCGRTRTTESLASEAD
jgi:hypothetical protein